MNDDNRRFVKLGLLAGVGLVALATAFGSYYTIEATEVGVVTRFGAIHQPRQEPGLHFKVPFIDTVHYIPTAVQGAESPLDKDGSGVNTYTIDNQEVDAKFTVFYVIPPEKAAYVYANVPGYQQRLVTIALDRLKAEMGERNIQQLAELRGEVRDQIKDRVEKDMAWYGIKVIDFQITDLEYDKAFRHAVSQAAVQKANIEANEYQRQQAIKTSETAKITAEGQANAARAAAAGAADSLLLQRTAEAKGLVLTREAEAKGIEATGLAQAAAIKAQTEALKDSPKLVELRQAERWDGKLPSSMYAGAPIPFLSVGK